MVKPAMTSAEREAVISKRLEEALAAIKQYNLIYIDEIAAFISYGRSTFYNEGLDKLDTIKDALNANRIKMKAGLRKKWYQNDNATTDIALYKLIGTDEESHRLNGSKVESHLTGAIDSKITVEFVEASDPEQT